MTITVLQGLGKDCGFPRLRVSCRVYRELGLFESVHQLMVKVFISADMRTAPWPRMGGRGRGPYIHLVREYLNKHLLLITRKLLGYFHELDKLVVRQVKIYRRLPILIIHLLIVYASDVELSLHSSLVVLLERSQHI